MMTRIPKLESREKQRLSVFDQVVQGATRIRTARGQIKESSTDLSDAILPESFALFLASDAKTSHKVTKEIESYFGFQDISNEFLNYPDVEAEFQRYYIEYNVQGACQSSMLVWVLWLLISISDIINLWHEDPEVRKISTIDCLLTFPVLVPVPFLVYICKQPKYNHHLQWSMTLVAHLFAFSLISGGVHSIMSEWSQNIETDMIRFLDFIGVSNSTEIFHFPEDMPEWEHYPMTTTKKGMLYGYLKNVVLPAAQLNINLARPIIVLVVAPAFRLQTFYYILVAFSCNLGYFALVAWMYPLTSAPFFITNKFLIVFALAGLTMILVSRVHKSERFMRLNFLHIRNIEEKARISEKEKVKIQKENIDLKKLLEDHTKGESEIDMDSPMAKIISDLKILEGAKDLQGPSHQIIKGIMQLLLRQGQNLFAPDIHAELRNKPKVQMDSDTKGWAASVLAVKGYARPLNSKRTTFISQELPRRDAVWSIHHRDVQSRLHHEVAPLEDSVVAQIQKQVNSDGWNIDTMMIESLTNNRPITYITFAIVNLHNLCITCSIDATTLTNFLWFVDEAYLANPYHNRCHGADVVASVAYLITTIDGGFILSLLDPLEFFAALIAAAIHDMAHPGKSNNFLIKSRHRLAIRYSDSSVLENMHLAEAFFLAENPNFNIFSELKPAAYSQVRKAIIEMVLCTDLSQHLQLVGTLKASLLTSSSEEVNENPIMLMKIVIKCADIGHSSKEIALHARWTTLIIEEFFIQGDLEAEMGMEISPFMNRSSENTAKNQIGFFEFIVIPFFDVVAQLVFSHRFNPIVNQVRSNYELWKTAEAKGLTNINDIVCQVLEPAIQAKIISDNTDTYHSDQ